MTRTTLASLVLSSVLVSSLLVALPGAAQRGRRGARREERRQERVDDARDRAAEALTGWTRLGERWIQGAVDHDTISAIGQGRFRQVTVRVEHSAAELFDIVFTFGDGTTYSPGTRLVFGPGTTTRVIDLPGDARIIRRVDFRVANLPGGGRAQVEIWAR